MEKRSRKIFKLTLFWIIPATLVLYLLIYTAFYIAGMRGTLAQWNEIVEIQGDTNRFQQEEWDLIHTKAYLNARLAMAESDSIGLSLNLTDSLIQLEMNGVVLRTVKADKIEIPRFFRGINPHAYAYHFSRPFTIQEIEGSVDKAPVTVRKAPKDTIEAAQVETTIDTSRKEFVEWHLILDNGIVISIVQSDQFDGRSGWATLKYRLRRHMQTLNSTNRSVVKARAPAHAPEISLFIPAAEAKSFFRALPKNGEVVIRL